jgi:hypothetical protein
MVDERSRSEINVQMRMRNQRINDVQRNLRLFLDEG